MKDKKERAKLHGARFGKWTIQKHIRASQYWCVCDCGKVQKIPLYNLRTGKSTGCRKCRTDYSRPSSSIPIHERKRMYYENKRAKIEELKRQGLYQPPVYTFKVKKERYCRICSEVIGYSGTKFYCSQKHKEIGNRLTGFISKQVKKGATKEEAEQAFFEKENKPKTVAEVSEYTVKVMRNKDRADFAQCGILFEEWEDLFYTTKNEFTKMVAMENMILYQSVGTVEYRVYKRNKALLERLSSVYGVSEIMDIIDLSTVSIATKKEVNYD